MARPGGCLGAAQRAVPSLPPPPPSRRSALDPQGSPCLEHPSPQSRPPWRRHSRLCSDPVCLLSVCLHTPLPPATPALLLPRSLTPVALSRWGGGLPQGQLSPQSRKREGACTSAPDGPSAQTVSPSALIIKGPWLLKVTSLRTRPPRRPGPARSLCRHLKRQRTCRPSSETPGHLVSGKGGQHGQRAHLGEALLLHARQYAPPWWEHHPPPCSLSPPCLSHRPDQLRHCSPSPRYAVEHAHLFSVNPQLSPEAQPLLPE